MEMISGRYIVFEGPGYSGKSTVMGLVAEELRQMGLEVVETREPGGCEEAEAIRERIFTQKAMKDLTARQEAHLFYVARLINMETVVYPAVEEGKIVLKDRDFMSSFLYQNNSGLKRDEVFKIHKMFEDRMDGSFEPDLRLMLYVSEKEVKKRISRGSEGDPFDEQALEMVGVYGAEALDISRSKGVFTKNTVVVDAGLPIEVVKESCLRLIKERLGLEEDRESKRRSVEY